MPQRDFQLIETMLFNGSVEHLDLHIHRLKISAGYFNFHFREEEIISKLEQKITSLDTGVKYRIRMLLHSDGLIEITETEVSGLPEVYTIAISPRRTFSRDNFLFHKTTRREFYNEELARAREEEYFDIIFMNERDEVTEGAITNIYIRQKGDLLTPPIHSGLLPGTIRSYLKKTAGLVEKPIYIKDLTTADEVLISNAIIGLQKVADNREIRILK